MNAKNIFVLSENPCFAAKMRDRDKSWIQYFVSKIWSEYLQQWTNSPKMRCWNLNRYAYFGVTYSNVTTHFITKGFPLLEYVLVCCIMLVLRFNKSWIYCVNSYVAANIKGLNEANWRFVCCELILVLLQTVTKSGRYHLSSKFFVLESENSSVAMTIKRSAENCLNLIANYRQHPCISKNDAWNAVCSTIGC